MATKAIFFFFVSAVCLSSLAGVANADADDFDSFQIQGSVYCDTCRVQFVTRLSQFLEGILFVETQINNTCSFLLFDILRKIFFLNYTQ